jgi:porin
MVYLSFAGLQGHHQGSVRSKRSTRSVLAGLGGNNLLAAHENDRWGIGFFHFGLTEPLLAGLAALDVNRRSEGGMEGFYNLAVTPWLRLSADLQVIDPWNPSASRATYAALRLQTKF